MKRRMVGASARSATKSAVGVSLAGNAFCAQGEMEPYLRAVRVEQSPSCLICLRFGNRRNSHGMKTCDSILKKQKRYGSYVKLQRNLSGASKAWQPFFPSRRTKWHWRRGAEWRGRRPSQRVSLRLSRCRNRPFHRSSWSTLYTAVLSRRVYKSIIGPLSPAAMTCREMSRSPTMTIRINMQKLSNYYVLLTYSSITHSS